MRHLGSIALAIVLTPLIYILAGVGEIKFATNSAMTAAGRGTDWTAIGIGVGGLVIAGGLFALLAMARISPLGPVLAALALIGVEVWAVLDQDSLIKLVGHSVFGVSGAAEAPLSGLALLLAVPLVITICSPRRWRSRDKVDVATYVPATAPDAAPTYATEGLADPTYPAPTSAAPTYMPTPEHSAPTQTTPETAADSRPTIVEHGTVVEEPDADDAEAEEAREQAKDE